MTDEPEDLAEGSGSGDGDETPVGRFTPTLGDEIRWGLSRVAQALESIDAQAHHRTRSHPRPQTPPGMWWAPGTVRRLVARGLITATVYGAVLAGAWLLAGLAGLLIAAAAVVAIEVASHDPHGDRGWWRWPSVREQVQLLVLMRRAIRDGTRRR